MKNLSTFVLVVILLVSVGLGCKLDRLTGSGEAEKSANEANKSENKTANETAEKKPSGETLEIGIKECDELATYINDNSETLNGNLLTRGIVYYYKNTILGELRDSVSKMNDEEKAKAGEACAKSLEELKKGMTEN